MKKIITICISLTVILILSYFIYNWVVLNNAFDKAGIVNLGKTLEISISKDVTRDYTFIENNIELAKWNDKEKTKFINYMKENTLLLKPGSYKINQGTTFEKAKDIFIFE